MNIKCIIIEDQPPAQRILKKYISDIGNLELIGTFSDALSAIDFIKTNDVALIFLDVHLPKLSGIEFVKILNPRPMIILTTAFSEYAIEGYELDITDYLLKPFSFERFVRAVTKVQESLVEKTDSDKNEGSKREGGERPPKNVFIKSGSEYLNIYFEQIKYVKADGDYTMVHMTGTKHLVAHPLRYWVQCLPTENFSQVHKSYVVNVSYIKKIVGSQIMLDDVTIPIGRTYKEIFASKYLG